MNKKGFTIVELLIAITIIGVLSAIGLNTYSGTQSVARDSIRKNDLNKLATAAELYFQKNSKYPLPQTGNEDCNRDTNNFYTEIKPYLSGDVPKDPKYKTTPYCYISINNGKSFRLFAKLENCNNSNNILCRYQNYNYSIVSDDLTIASAPKDSLLVSSPPSATPTSTSIPSPTPSTTPSPTSAPTSSPSPTASPTPAAPYKRVFVTGRGYQGNLKSLGSDVGLGSAQTGVDGANKICQVSANDPDGNNSTNDALGGTWKAWISDSARSPANQLDADVWIHFNGEYRLVDGITKVANSWSNFVNGGTGTTVLLLNPINQDEKGSQQLSEYVWTNTNTSGRPVLTNEGGTCKDWTSPGAESSLVGHTSYKTMGWTNTGGFTGCSNPYHLYCFEQ